METGKHVTLSCDFAGDIIPGIGMYDHATPSQLFKVIAQAEKECGSLDFSAEMTERIMQFMPERMVGMKANSKGAVEFSVYKKADFLSPSGPAGSTIKGSGLVSVLANDVIMEGAMPFTSARKVLQTIRIESGAEQIPFFTPRTAAKKVAANADAIDLAEGIGMALAVPKEYKLMCTLDKGLLADASADVKAAAFREMGANMEIALEQEAVDVCLANCYGTATSAAAADALKGLNLARGQIGKNGFRATGALIAPMFEGYALNSMAVPAYNERAQEVGEYASLIRFAGLDLGVTGATGMDWGTSTNVGALVVDKSHAPQIIMRTDMTMEDFDNTTKYALQPVVVSRFCVVAASETKKSANTGAVVKVTNS